MSKILTVTNISAMEAAEVTLGSNSVLISINEENEPLYPLQCGRNPERVFTVVFSDVTRRTEKANGNVYLPINSDQARAMYNFIAKNKDKHFITHCAAGVSRSGAVALFIHNEYGHTLKPMFWETSNPNCYVMGRLLFAKHEKRKDDL